MDRAEDVGHRAHRGARIVLLDVHVVRVGEDPHAVRAGRRDQLGRLRDRVDHVVLVAVERLEQQDDAGCLGVRAERGKALDEHLAILVGRPWRLVERRQPAREHAPRRRGDHAAPAQRGDPVELAAQVVDRLGTARGVEVAEPAAERVRAHGRRPAVQAVEPCAGGVAQLQRVEPNAPRELQLRADRVAWHEVLLDREDHAASPRRASRASTFAGASTCSRASVVTPTTPARGPSRLVRIRSSRVASADERM
jgi:hypothetical protein